MDPQRLTELLTAWMWEYMRRASYELAAMACGHDDPGEKICQIKYKHVMMPAWLKMMEELNLPLQAPDDDEDHDAQVEELAEYIRSYAQGLAQVKEQLSEEQLPEPPPGTLMN